MFTATITVANVKAANAAVMAIVMACGNAIATGGALG
jgi:hypothetical protein